MREDQKEKVGEVLDERQNKERKRQNEKNKETKNQKHTAKAKAAVENVQQRA